MMKFNTTKQINVTTNYEGAKAYRLSPELELYTAVVTCLVDDKYYEIGSNRVNQIRHLIQKCPHELTAKLTVYARTEMNLRSIPVVLAVELAKIHSGNNLVAKTVNSIIQRTDEINEKFEISMIVDVKLEEEMVDTERERNNYAFNT
jgi:hypothetical protein